MGLYFVVQRSAGRPEEPITTYTRAFRHLYKCIKALYEVFIVITKVAGAP